ncbi:MAG: twitching motility protein, partial [Desulfovibrionales bacterium]|nr:twitching motility protein [Desulfovibrionales bacterium]
MKRQQLNQLLSRMLDSHEKISDLNFTPGKPPQVVCSGELVPVLPSMGCLTPFQTETIALGLLGTNVKQTRTLLENGACDLSYALGSRARFRVNIFSSFGRYSIVLRRLSVNIPHIQGMGLPPTFFKIANEENGLVFFTGATGVGKTTSLAAILN